MRLPVVGRRRPAEPEPNVHLERLAGLSGRPYRLTTDAWEEAPRFGFDSLADAIAKIILESNPQLTLGLYGDWGMGKTTLLHAIETRITGSCAVAWFDIWEYKNQQNVIGHLLEAVAASLPPGSELRNSISTFARAALASASVNAGYVSFSGKDLLDEVDAAFSLKEADKLETKTLASYVEKWREGDDGEGPSRRIVIFVDNLDRCLAEHAVGLLEQITTLFGFDGVVFVLAAQKDRLADAVERKYKLPRGEGPIYLEKIVQVEFHVPGLDETHVLRWISTLTDPPFELAAEEAQLLAQVANWNPRQIKRLLNNVRIQLCTASHPIADDRGLALASTLLFHHNRALWLELTRSEASRSHVRAQIDASQ